MGKVDFKGVTRTFLLPLVVLVVVGCAARPRQDVHVVRAAASDPVTEASPILTGYRIGCPDVVRVEFRKHPQRDCLTVVDLDGRLNLGKFGRPIVYGLTTDEVRETIANTGSISTDDVTITVVEPRAARVYLSGPDSGKRRIVTYIGPERVLDFLHRVEALTPGLTDIRDVTVVRRNVASGSESEVFPLDWSAVVLGKSDSNVMLQPSDEVYVGEMRRSSFTRMLPRWAVPSYRRFLNCLPSSHWFRLR